MSDSELLEAGIDALFAAFAVGALLFPLTLLSAAAIGYLRNAVGEGWGPLWEARAAFRFSVLAALWVPVVGLLTRHQWWNSAEMQGLGVLVLIALVAWASLRQIWRAGRGPLAAFWERAREGWTRREDHPDDRTSLEGHKNRLEAKMRWLEHEISDVSERAGPFARLKERRLGRSLLDTAEQLEMVEERLLWLEADRWSPLVAEAPRAAGRET